MKLKLHHIEQLEGDVRSFVFEAPAEFTWKPGQYMHITLEHDSPDDRGIERWFTIAAPPYEKMPRITTRIVAERPSTFKQALAALKPGDTIEADQPEGSFVLGDENDEYVLIAGGIGFTPFHAILSQLNHEGRMPSAMVLYGTRDPEPVFHQELDAFTAAFPQLKVQYVVEPLRVNEEVIMAAVSDIHKPFFYVSGPEPMVDAFDAMLKKMGVSDDKIRNDHFPGYTWQPGS